MRTQQAIVDRYKEREKSDFLGFEVTEYLRALNFEHAQPFLKPETTREEWAAMGRLSTDEAVRKEMREYVDFAYEKIDGERGISANRTVMHYIAWIWLIGEDDLLHWVEHEFEHNYHGYGRHIMDEIVARLGLRESEKS